MPTFDTPCHNFRNALERKREDTEHAAQDQEAFALLYVADLEARIAKQDADILDLTDTNLQGAAGDLFEAAVLIEEWWLREGKHSFNGAPAGIFAIRASIAKAKGES